MRHWAVWLALAPSFLACSTQGGGDIASVELCPAIELVVELDDVAEGVVNDYYLSLTDGAPTNEDPLGDIWGMLDDYNASLDALAEAVPAEYVEDVRALRALNDALVDGGLEAATAEEFDAAMSSIDPQLQEDVGRGLLRLDGLSRSECGMVLAD